MLRRVLIRGAVAAAVVLASPSLAQEGGTIELAVGARRELSVRGLQRVDIADPSVADVKPLGNDTLLVLGNSEGKTALVLWKSSGQRVDYLVSVRKPKPPAR